MKFVFRVLSQSILLCTVAACTIHPLPEDVSTDTTLEIVKKIRCEAAEALNLISAERFADVGDERHTSFAEQIFSREKEVEEIFLEHGRTLHPSVQALFYEFVNTGVGFDFTFTMSADQDNSADANFRLPLTNGTFTIGFKSGKKLTRKNEREFIIGSSFLELHNKDFQLDEYGIRFDCNDVVVKQGNIKYPITGQIGLKEVFDTYIRLAQQGGSQFEREKTTGPEFTETLTFTTTLTASVNPKITLNPVSDRIFRLASASGTIAGTRADIHKVRIALAQGKPFSFEDLTALKTKKPKAIARITSSQREAARRLLEKRRTQDVFILDADQVLNFQQ